MFGKISNDCKTLCEEFVVVVKCLDEHRERKLERNKINHLLTSELFLYILVSIYSVYRHRKSASNISDIKDAFSTHLNRTKQNNNPKPYILITSKLHTGICRLVLANKLTK